MKSTGSIFNIILPLRLSRKATVALALPALLSTLNCPLSIAHAQGTAFSYQGRLNDGGSPANGSYDLTFALFDASSAGSQAGNTITNAGMGVTNGLFTVLLDFGNPFTGPPRWLEIGVRPNSGGDFTTLNPRQALTPTPYSVMANTASSLLGTLPAAQLSSTIPMADLPAAVVTNGATGLALTGTFSGDGAGLTGISGSSIQSGTIGSTQLADGVGVVSLGGIVLSATASNASLTTAGFVLFTTNSPVTVNNWTEATAAPPVYPAV